MPSRRVRSLPSALLHLRDHGPRDKLIEVSPPSVDPPEKRSPEDVEKLAARVALAREASASLQAKFAEVIGASREIVIANQEVRTRASERRDALRSATELYARLSRGSGSTAERMLIELKHSLRLEAATSTDDDARVLAQQVIAWSIQAYYSETAA